MRKMMLGYWMLDPGRWIPDELSWFRQEDRIKIKVITEINRKIIIYSLIFKVEVNKTIWN
jgi:hypothetical protein